MIKDAITYAEKACLVIIALFTVFAMYQEVVKVVTHWNVELKDLLLYESAAILMISLACVAIGYHQKNAEQTSRENADDRNDSKKVGGHRAGLLCMPPFRSCALQAGR